MYGCFQDAGIVVRDFEVFLASLNDQGYLLKKGPRIFQLQVTDYWSTDCSMLLDWIVDLLIWLTAM